MAETHVTTNTQTLTAHVIRCGDRTSWAQPIRRVYCEIAFNATDAELAALFGIMDRRVKTVDAERTKNIYIASPPSETALMARVEKLLAKEVNFRC